MARIPATVVTGFLGAGKTSLLQHLVREARGRRLALIVNEFGDFGVDGGVVTGCGIEGCADEDVVELTNGCLCCTVADDFVPTLEKLLERETPPDHILIETSGLALPKPLLKAFQWPSVRTRVTVDGVVAVIDAAAVAAGTFADDPSAIDAARREDPSLDHDSPLEELFEDQLGAADLVLINKTDLLEETGLGEVEKTVTGYLRPGVRMVRTTGGKADSRVALGLGAEAEADLDSRKSHHDGVDGEHDHDDFESFVLTVPPLGDPVDFEARLGTVMQNHKLLRAKGFLAIAGKPMRRVVQAVGPRIDGHFDRPWGEGEGGEGRLVMIGLAGLDAEAIEAELNAA